MLVAHTDVPNHPARSTTHLYKRGQSGGVVDSTETQLIGTGVLRTAVVFIKFRALVVLFSSEGASCARIRADARDGAVK